MVVEADPQAASSGLVVLDGLNQALSLSTSLDEVRTMRDQAEAVRQYLKQQSAGLDSQNDAAAFKLRAERRLGELLIGLAKNVGGQPEHSAYRSQPGTSRASKLADLGITKNDSSRWQKEAAVSEADFEHYLADCRSRREEITSIGLLRLAAKLENGRNLATYDDIAGPAGLYRTVVIDPPWPMKRSLLRTQPTVPQDLDYPTLSIGEIADRVPPVMPDGAHVYLWVTQKFLRSGFDLFDTWGVRYECLLTWVKPRGMTAFSWMYNTEHVLFGRVGTLPMSKMGEKLTFEAKADRHSAKPEIFYDLVRKVSPEPRLDMYARKGREGFDVWGNEV